MVGVWGIKGGAIVELVVGIGRLKRSTALTIGVVQTLMGHNVR